MRLLAFRKRLIMIKEKGEVELTAAERRTLVWLAGWEESTVVNVISAVRKAMAAEAKRQGLTPVRRTEKPSAERKGSF